MSAMRTDAELELEQQLIGVAQARIAAVAILRANLAEFAGPISQDSRLLRVIRRRTEQPVGLVDAYAGEPAPGQLVFPGNIIAEHLAQTERLLPMVPNQLCPAHERVVDRAPQRLPAYRRIHSVDAANQEITLGRQQCDIGRRGVRTA